MGKIYDRIEGRLAEFIARQRVFFVATAPLAESGLLNLSPKRLDSFAILGPREVAYLDFHGSGIETVAHLRENGRIVLMFCAFEGPPNIVRLHGRGAALEPGDPGFAELRERFPAGHEHVRTPRAGIGRAYRGLVWVWRPALPLRRGAGAACPVGVEAGG
jgi:hypothetical protein